MKQTLFSYFLITSRSFHVENFYIFSAIFLKFEKKNENSPEIQKKVPHLETSRSDLEIPEEGLFQF